MDDLSIALFAFLGGVSRYGLGLWLPTWHAFPVATLSVNLLGSFLLVFIGQYVAHQGWLSARLIAGISSGFLGAFTTFSSFSVDTMKLFQQHLFGTAGLYIGLSCIGGFFCAELAYQLAHRLLKREHA
ncbi:hypothetical protein IV38_GL001656 [Lactobacillus selangorensis]|uniref:Fluoride-specific ion channel FluC n=1 Tax=Lactobacillus selangorensis TaxID=81857 RepID=A0A0R2G0G5_9LACO|nr:CrcB family protein [Lactobacillus selangorensis]KRN28202.1 hypothetical protein IV38_GL001656 [Lactobacillus selangorensis]KRN30922.1 hypothetical protein IV40_GL001559 [Lactobacillus selangorensis]